MMSDKRIVLTTAGDREEAFKIAQALVERRVAACVNVVGPIDSVYRWQGNVERAQEYLQRGKVKNKIRFLAGDALKLIDETEGQFDIIFNDIDKDGYPDSLPVTKEKLRHGGLLIIDNMLWHGQTLDPNDHESTTEAIRRFTRDITNDLDWIVSLIPARDGMIVAYKK